MEIISKKMLVTVFSIASMSAAGCSGMTRGERTVVGAGIGAASGAVLTDGHPAGVIGGAAVGGVIGHETDDGYDRHDRHRRHHGH